MANMRLERSALPAAAIGLMTCALMIAIAVAILKLLAPFQDARITGAYFWATIWTHGLAGYCGEGLFGVLNLRCRFDTIGQWLAYPPFQYRAVICLVGAAVAALGAGAFMHSKAIALEKMGTVRGSWPVYDRHARQFLRRCIKKTGQYDANSFWLAPYVPLSPEAEAYNVMLLGGHGSGKTSVLRGWAEQWLERGERCIVHDAKGDMLASLPVDDIVLVAPHDARNWIWDIGRDVTNSQTAREFAAKFVVGATSGESMWRDGARALLVAAIEVLIHRHGTAWGWQELFDILFQSPAKFRGDMVEARTPTAHLIEFDEGGAPTRTTMSLLLTMWVAALTTIRPLAETTRSGKSNIFSIRDWLSDRSELPRTLVVQHASDYELLSEAVSGLLVDLISRQILSPAFPLRNEGWLHLILDELPVLGYLKEFPKLLNVGREKGVRTIVAVQDWDRIVEIFGQNDAATLEARFKIKVVCQLGISETRNRVVSLYGGKRTIETWEHSGDPNGRKVRRETEVDVIEARQLSDDLGVRKRGKNLIVRVAIFGLGNPAILDIPATIWPARREGHNPADWQAEHEVG